MARVTFVKHAQQRYATVPVLDEDGRQKSTPVLRRSGQPKTTKRGSEVVRRQTTVDKTRPLPNRKCGKCGAEIKVGDSYKWIAPKSGPYGGRKLYRCAICPTWHVWEYSSSLSARLSQVSYDFNLALDGADSPDDVRSALSGAADAIRGIAGEKQEAADNIESGFQHATSMSEELADIAQQLEGWADDIENADIPDLPDPQETPCEDCDGSGRVPSDDDEDEDEIDCETCDGSGEVTPDEPTEDQMDEWRQEVQDATSIVDESPV